MLGDGFMDKTVQGGGIGTFDHASDDIPFPLHSTDDNELARSARASEIPAPALAFMLVLGLPPT